MLHRIAHALKGSWRGIIGMALAIAFVASLAAPVLADTTTGNISGTVTANGQPVAGVNVVATAPSGRYTATTDAKGFFGIVGVLPDTYSISFTKSGFADARVDGVTVNPTITATVNQALSARLITIGSTTSRSSGVSAFQPQQPQDTYSVNANQIQTILGKSHAVSETQLIVSLPGASLDAFGYPVLRGGRQNDEGFQFEGIDYTDAFTHQFVNSLALNGVSNFQLSPGAGDASVGNVGTGQINATVKRGTRPAFGSLELDSRTPTFDHSFFGEYGWATPDGRLSSFTSDASTNTGATCGNRGTDCNLVGGQLLFDLTTSRDFIENGVLKFGRDNNQSLQAFYQNQNVVFDANAQFLPAALQKQLPFRTSAPDYINNTALSLFNTVSPAAINLIQGLLPFQYGQTSLTQTINRSAIGQIQPNDTLKLQYSNSLNQSTFMTVKAYKVNSTAVFDFAYGSQSCQGAFTGALCDFYTIQGGQRTGLAADFTKQLGTKHLLGFGAKYEFIHPIDTFQSASLGIVASVFGNAGFIGDFLPGGLAAGSRIPDYNQSPVADRHDTGLYISDQFQATDKFKITAGLRMDRFAFTNYPNITDDAFNVPNGYSSGFYLPVATGLDANGNPDPTKDVYNPDTHRTGSVLQPRFGFAYQFNPKNSVTFSYGRSVEMPPIADVDFRIPRSQYAGFAGIPANPNEPVCGPTGDRVCRNFADMLYWENQNTNGGVPINPLKPGTFNNYDMSFQHDFGNGLSGKVTPFYRRGYDVPILAQAPLIQGGQPVINPANGNPVNGPPQSSNLGTSFTSGVEFYMTKTAAYGLSGTLSLTYLNEFTNVVPLSGSEDFFPSVPTSSLFQGNLYRVGFISPFNGSLALQYKWRNGLRVNPIIGFNIGYPISPGLLTTKTFSGQNFNVPNTNVTSSGGSSVTGQFVDPVNPGTIFNPNIAATRGVSMNPSPGGILSAPRVNIASLDLEYNKPGTRSTFGVLVTNLFDQVYSQPALNTRFQPVATGISGPKSGTQTPTALFPNLGYTNFLGIRQGNLPYLLTPGSTPTQFRLYYQLSL